MARTPSHSGALSAKAQQTAAIGAPGAAALFLSLVTMLVVVWLGHDGRRIAQLAALAAPPFLTLLWPATSPWQRRWRTGLLWLWSGAFVLDATTRGYLWQMYQAAPDGAMVVAAVANTTAREGREFLSMYWQPMAAWAAAGLGAWLVLSIASGHGARSDAAAVHARGNGLFRQPRWLLGITVAVLLLGTLAYASKPWRRLHPVVFWAQWETRVSSARSSWAGQEQAHRRELERARVARPWTTHTGPSTVVLVIADSINRDNMSLYGYGRATTPQLGQQKAALQDRLVVVPNAWSVDASTVPALNNIFHFGAPPMPAGAAANASHAPHAIALARAAGFKVWWISNHDDLAIEQTHARLADVVDIINRTPGRSSASLDSELLDCVREAVEDTSAERKLIVVHLMGAHPHYRHRFPPDANPFDDGVDAVESGLAARGRSAWVRRFRTQYDAAMLYHDSVVANLLQITRHTGASTQQRAWMYLSDHGQEVGHDSDHAGHSALTAAGYRIPVMWWREPHQALPPGHEGMPFRADWTGHTLMGLLGIQWSGNDPSRDIASERYVWHAPRMPAQIDSFNR